jgi:phage baseplate assembly protein W
MIELKYPLQLTPQGSFASTTSYEEIWRQRVVSTVSTQLGTRVMRPDFGSSIGDQVFENMSSRIQENIQNRIAEVFSKHLRELTLSSVETIENDEEGSVVATVWFTLPNGQQVSSTVSDKSTQTNLYEYQFDSTSTIQNIWQPYRPE